MLYVYIYPCLFSNVAYLTFIFFFVHFMLFFTCKFYVWCLYHMFFIFKFSVSCYKCTKKFYIFTCFMCEVHVLYIILFDICINYQASCLHHNHIGCLFLHFSYYYFMCSKFHVLYSHSMLCFQNLVFHVVNRIKILNIHDFFHVWHWYFMYNIICQMYKVLVACLHRNHIGCLLLYFIYLFLKHFHVWCWCCMFDIRITCYRL